jgi:hypothetical protein
MSKCCKCLLGIESEDKEEQNEKRNVKYIYNDGNKSFDEEDIINQMRN